MFSSSGNKPILGFTENNSATYLSSQNPCLDFFFHVVPDTPARDVISRLEVSWNHNPLTTLKLVCNLRGVRGTGKMNKKSFYTAALWIHNHHPKTLASNVPLLVEFGYFKDLLEVLYRLIEGPDVRRIAKSQWILKKSWKGKGELRKQYFLLKKEINNRNKNKCDDEMKAKLRAKVPREQRIEANMVQMKAEQERAKASRKEKESAMAEKARNRYKSDPNYKLLHDQVTSFFADCLRSDIQSLNSGETTKISLAAKWCPSIDSSYDNAILICEAIATIIYPRNSDPEFDNLEDADYIFKIKNRLRKQILVPLRKALQLPEVYMSAKQWSSISYERVASIAMKNYTDIFLHRDKTRFREYLQNVNAGDAKIAAGALLPHEIIASSKKGSIGATKVAEAQWKRMVDDLLKKGKLTNCIAICDVSGSMIGTPMEVAVALGLLVSELSAEPWKGHVITFSESPQLHMIKGNNLKSKTEFIKNMDWGVNTNFQKVFDRMLEVAGKKKLGEDQMVERVFVFSDMEFDQASAGHRSVYPGVYSGGYPGGYRGGYPGGYRGGYSGIYPSVYPGVYHGGHPGVYYGGYPGAYPGGYPGAYPGGYPGAYPGGYPGAYRGIYPYAYLGGYPGAYLGGYPGAYPGGYPGVYPGGHLGVYPSVYRGGHMGGYHGGHPAGYPGDPYGVYMGGYPVGHPSVYPGGHLGGYPGGYLSGHPSVYHGGHPAGYPIGHPGSHSGGYDCGYPIGHPGSHSGGYDCGHPSNPWETDYEVIERKFKAHGYEKVPEIVFWNLRDSGSTPVTSDKKGVALLSGFSKNLLTLFLEEGGVIKPEDLPKDKSQDVKVGGDTDRRLNPQDRMEAAISGELYQKLVVCD